MKTSKTISLLILASFLLLACVNTGEKKNPVISNDDKAYLQAADTAILSTMSVQEKLKTIMVYKLAEYIDLNQQDSIYTLGITMEEAKKLGVDKKTYNETVASIEEVNRIIADYNRSHDPNHTIELTDFKQLVNERKGGK